MRGRRTIRSGRSSMGWGQISQPTDRHFEPCPHVEAVTNFVRWLISCMPFCRFRQGFPHGCGRDIGGAFDVLSPVAIHSIILKSFLTGHRRDQASIFAIYIIPAAGADLHREEVGLRLAIRIPQGVRRGSGCCVGGCRRGCG